VGEGDHFMASRILEGVIVNPVKCEGETEGIFFPDFGGEMGVET